MTEHFLPATVVATPPRPGPASAVLNLPLSSPPMNSTAGFHPVDGGDADRRGADSGVHGRRRERRVCRQWRRARCLRHRWNRLWCCRQEVLCHVTGVMLTPVWPSLLTNNLLIVRLSYKDRTVWFGLGLVSFCRPL